MNTDVRNARRDQEQIDALHRLDEECIQLQRTGNYLQAFDRMERALVLRRHFFGAESPEVLHACRALAEMCNLLSMSFLQQDNYAVTLELLKKAEILSQHHPKEKATTLNNLACYYRRLGKLHTAMTCLKKALVIEKKTLGDVRNAADTHLNICAVMSQLNKHDQALEHAQAALVSLQDEFFKKSSAGAEHRISTASSPSYQQSESESDASKENAQLERISVMCIAYHNMGVEQEFLKDYESCVVSYKKGVGLAEQYLGIDHAITTTIRNSYLAAKRTISTKRSSARHASKAAGGKAKMAPLSPRALTPPSSLRLPSPLAKDKNQRPELPSPRSIVADALARGNTLPPLDSPPTKAHSKGLSPEDPFFSPRYRFETRTMIRLPSAEVMATNDNSTWEQHHAQIISSDGAVIIQDDVEKAQSDQDISTPSCSMVVEVPVMPHAHPNEQDLQQYFDMSLFVYHEDTQVELNVDDVTHSSEDANETVDALRNHGATFDQPRKDSSFSSGRIRSTDTYIDAAIETQETEDSELTVATESIDLNAFDKVEVPAKMTLRDLEEDSASTTYVVVGVDAGSVLETPQDSGVVNMPRYDLSVLQYPIGELDSTVGHEECELDARADTCAAFIGATKAIDSPVEKLSTAENEEPGVVGTAVVGNLITILSTTDPIETLACVVPYDLHEDGITSGVTQKFQDQRVTKDPPDVVEYDGHRQSHALREQMDETTQFDHPAVDHHMHLLNEEGKVGHEVATSTGVDSPGVHDRELSRVAIKETMCLEQFSEIPHSSMLNFHDVGDAVAPSLEEMEWSEAETQETWPQRDIVQGGEMNKLDYEHRTEQEM